MFLAWLIYVGMVVFTAGLGFILRAESPNRKERILAARLILLSPVWFIPIGWVIVWSIRELWREAEFGREEKGNAR